MRGTELLLVCNSDFTAKMIDKPDILAVVSQKASAKLGTRISVKVVDGAAAPAKNEQMEQLLRFGRAHPDFIKIKE